MTTSRRYYALGVMALMVVGMASSSWAWRGRYGGGWRGGGGWYGPSVGLYVGGPYYDPYYYGYPYRYGAPYVYPYVEDGAYATVPYASGDDTAAPAVSEGGRDLDGVERTAGALMAQVKNDYDDGDISKDQRNTRLKAIKQIRDEARKEASANSGSLTPEQADTYLNRLTGRRPSAATTRAATTTTPSAPSLSTRPQNEVGDLLLELRSLLDQKVKDGQITSAQAQSERRLLDQIEQQSHTGNPNDLVQRLHQAYYQINHNFVTE